jgi:hypothetical protein
MSEYLSKKAVLEWLTEQYFHGMGEEAWNTAISKLQEKIESGAFDADESEGTWKATAEVFGRENAQMNSEVQRLREALEEVYEELKTLHFMIDHDDDIFHERKKKYLSIIDYVGQSVAGQALSTTTEPTGPYTIRRNEYGHAVAIERNGYTVLHLQPGTERNEQEVEGIVALLNMNAAKVERVREGDGNDA